jgi:hypothetical protein
MGERMRAYRAEGRKERKSSEGPLPSITGTSSMILRNDTDTALTDATEDFDRELRRLADRNTAYLSLAERWRRYAEPDRAVDQSIQTTAAFTERGLIAA